MSVASHEEAAKAHEEVQNFDGNATEHHKAKFSHEFIGAACGFAAMKAYEEHEKKKGKPVNHAVALELFTGLASAAVDKLFESKGFDFLDREKAKQHAKKQTEELAKQEGKIPPPP